uniref:hypothetical protein n=1 Tax=Mesorhizobium atlanticum TaxID=2233532 RepID=UPI003704879B
MAVTSAPSGANFLIWADDRHLVPDGAGIDFTAAFFKQGASGGDVNVERVSDFAGGGPMVVVGREPDPGPAARYHMLGSAGSLRPLLSSAPRSGPCRKSLQLPV